MGEGGRREDRKEERGVRGGRGQGKERIEGWEKEERKGEGKRQGNVMGEGGRREG